jgi:hypothetical protein
MQRGSITEALTINSLYLQFKAISLIRNMSLRNYIMYKSGAKAKIMKNAIYRTYGV